MYLYYRYHSFNKIHNFNFFHDEFECISISLATRTTEKIFTYHVLALDIFTGKIKFDEKKVHFKLIEQYNFVICLFFWNI